jgi:hypothetical protein
VIHLLRFARWILAVPAGLMAGAIVWFAASIALDAFGIEFPNWLFFLVMAYAWMAAGFVFAGTATKLAPAARTRVAQLMIAIALAGALLLVLRGEYGVAAGVVFGLSLLAGAVGYALRLRGFTEPINAGT